MSKRPEPTDLERVLAYHQVTKHAPGRYARALGYMDWDTQPDPFRRYDGAPRFDLPLRADGLQTRYVDLHLPGAVSPHELNEDALGCFFELALGLTAWKEYGEARWSLRADPSSGNLHPTEAYAVLPRVGSVAAGVHHYNAHDHCLEQRAEAGDEQRERVEALLPDGGFLVVVSSIHWRESWKYGERAFRYCQHDAGHVLGTLRYAAAALGWSARLIDGVGDDTLARLAGTDRDADFAGLDAHDRESADYLVAVGPDTTCGVASAREIEQLAELFATASWQGRANELSGEHHEWDIIEAVADAARYAGSAPVEGATRTDEVAEPLQIALPNPAVRAAAIIRGRRSAVAMDNRTTLSRDAFYAILDRTLPRDGAAPIDVLPWTPRVHLAIFVHRVDGLAPGLYWFERDASVTEEFRTQLGDGPLWTTPEGCPAHLRLTCITERDLRGISSAISCQQEIAGAGAFSLGMIADYRTTLERGAHWYRRLFWEAGLIGQVLYLEAEAHGLRGTGIGCYFDDQMHRVLGIEGDRFQDLYHFTVGGPVDDARLVTHPPYAHLERASS